MKTTPTQEAAEAIKKLHLAKKEPTPLPLETRIAELEKAQQRLKSDFVTLGFKLSQLTKSTGLGEQFKQAIAKRKAKHE